MRRPFPFNDIARAREILGVFLRHGFGNLLGKLPKQLLGDHPTIPDEANRGLTGPERVLRVIEELGPTFVKLGQILSTRPDLLSQDYLDELAKLQDSVPPFPAEVAERVITDELRQPIEQLFATFEPEPVASASIAQVHRATLPDGTAVAVKVQRPDIEELIRSDIHILYGLLEAAQESLEPVGLYSPVAVLQQFERAVTSELDFLMEARNAETLGRNLAEIEGIRVPEVKLRLSTHRVLTATWLDGVSLSRLDESGVEPQIVMDRVVKATFQQVFVDGFFHADPHPGNLLVSRDGSLGYVDFGIMGSLTRGQQDLLIDLFTAIILRDGQAVARACYRAGGAEDRLDLRNFSREADELFSRYGNLSMGEQPMGTIFTDLIQLTSRHRLRLPEEYAMLARAGVTLDGLARTHVPDWNMFETLKPMASDLALQRHDIGRVSADALSMATNAMGAARDLPLQLEQIVMDLEHGRLTIRTHNDDLESLNHTVRRVGTRMVLALGAASLLVSAAVLTAGTEANLFGFPFMKLISAIAIVVSLGSASGLLGALGFHMFITRRLRPRIIRRLISWVVRRGKSSK